MTAPAADPTVPRTAGGLGWPLADGVPSGGLGWPTTPPQAPTGEESA
jgi:hypothetical protein